MALQAVSPEAALEVVPPEAAVVVVVSPEAALEAVPPEAAVVVSEVGGSLGAVLQDFPAELAGPILIWAAASLVPVVEASPVEVAALLPI